MLTKSQIDKKFAEQALKAEALTPQHSAAEAGLDAEDTEGPGEAERRRERVQHLAEPYPPDLPEVDELDCAEMGKRYRQAADTPVGYPSMGSVDPERFRRGPLAGHAALSPGYEQPGRPVAVPSATLAPGMITRPPLTDGRSRPCAPEAC